MNRKQRFQRQRELLHRYNEDQSRNPGNNTIAFFDGACEPMNPGGNMGIGACIRRAGEELFKHSSFIEASPNNSNNVAEYMALEAILDFIIDNLWQEQTLTIYGDSRLVIEQIFGKWKIKGGRYVPYAKSCIEKLSLIRSHKNTITGIWIRREQNSYADQLSKAELVNKGVEFKLQPNE